MTAFLSALDWTTVLAATAPNSKNEDVLPPDYSRSGVGRGGRTRAELRGSTNPPQAVFYGALERPPVPNRSLSPLEPA